MVRRFFIALIILGITLGLISPVSAVEAPSPTNSQPKNKGLYISPLRNYVAVSPGDTVTRAFTVANLTEKPMTISAHVEQFSVADYTYDYRFNEVENNWIQLVENVVTLKPYESHEMAYKVALPANATPGGHYYTLIASSQVDGGAANSTVQAATLLYLTVNGNLKRTFTITSSLPRFVLSPAINSVQTIRNTGNIHYFGYSTSQVDGLFYHNAPNGTSQLFMPGTTRDVNNTVSSPLVPGIYRLTYTFTPDQGTRFTGSQYFVFLPPWSIALLIIILAIIVRIVWPKLKRRRHT